MSEKTKKSLTVITPPFIISYPKILTAEQYKGKGDFFYSFEAISDPDSLKQWRVEDRETGEFNVENIELVLVRLAKETWGQDLDIKQAVRDKTLFWPFKSGDKKFEEKGEKAEHYKGKKFWRAKAMAEINGSPNVPNLYFEDNGLCKIERNRPNAKELIDQKFYGGAICSAEINIVPFKNDAGVRYLTFYFNAVVFEEDGDKLGGGTSIERLRGVRGGQTTADPTEGMSKDLDDEIPF